MRIENLFIAREYFFETMPVLVMELTFLVFHTPALVKGFSKRGCSSKLVPRVRDKGLP
jgi:hypothetical protein